MDVLPFGPFGFVSGMIALGLLVPLITTGLIVGVIVWAIRRAAPAEISPIEFQVRMRALRDGED